MYQFSVCAIDVCRLSKAKPIWLDDELCMRRADIKRTNNLCSSIEQNIENMVQESTTPTYNWIFKTNLSIYRRNWLHESQWNRSVMLLLCHRLQYYWRCCIVAIREKWKCMTKTLTTCLFAFSFPFILHSYAWCDGRVEKYTGTVDAIRLCNAISVCGRCRFVVSVCLSVWGSICMCTFGIVAFTAHFPYQRGVTACICVRTQLVYGLLKRLLNIMDEK